MDTINKTINELLAFTDKYFNSNIIVSYLYVYNRYIDIYAGRDTIKKLRGYFILYYATSYDKIKTIIIIYWSQVGETAVTWPPD
jgi:hypothetical protein